MPKSAKSFSAVLERDGTRLNWVIIRIPLNVAKIWGTRGMLRVKGQNNACALRTSLFPTGRGSHIMVVNKRMQAGGRVKPGALAQFRLEPDTEERIVTVPAELKRILSEDKSFRLWYDQLGYSTRKEVSQWVGQVKSPEARCAAPNRSASACWPPWKRNATCRRSYRWPSRAISLPARDGSACRYPGGADTCWVSFIIEARKRVPVA